MPLLRLLYETRREMSAPQSREPLPQWSHTRAATLATCARRYFYRYVLARGGWRTSAPPNSRRAYVLSHLTTLDQAIGLVIHRLAAACARQVLARRRLPSTEDVHKAAAAHLNAIYRNGRAIGAFLRDPVAHPVLLEHYYGREVSHERISRTKAKIERCARHLARSAIWPELAGASSTSVKVVERPTTFSLGGALVWAAPDLMFTPSVGPPVIVDWKTGRINVEQTDQQLCVYAAWAVKGSHLPKHVQAVDGRVADLLTGELWAVTLGVDAVAATEERIRGDIPAIMTAEAAATEGASAYPQTHHRSACRSCPFHAFCFTQEVKGAGTSDPQADPDHE